MAPECVFWVAYAERREQTGEGARDGLGLPWLVDSLGLTGDPILGPGFLIDREDGAERTAADEHDGAEYAAAADEHDGAELAAAA